MRENGLPVETFDHWGWWWVKIFQGIVLSRIPQYIDFVWFEGTKFWDKPVCSMSQDCSTRDQRRSKRSKHIQTSIIKHPNKSCKNNWNLEVSKVSKVFKDSKNVQKLRTSHLQRKKTRINCEVFAGHPGHRRSFTTVELAEVLGNTQQLAALGIFEGENWSCELRLMFWSYRGYKRKIWLVVTGTMELYDFPYFGNNYPNWLSYFSEGLKPATRSMFPCL